MKVIEINKYGTAEVLTYKEDITKPEVGSYKILVHNKATRVNPVDILKRGGYGRQIFEMKCQNKFPWIMGRIYCY